jgi:putative phosphonate metabolism protein
VSPRYAVYFAPPPASPWGVFGASWLGRDAATDAAVPQPPIAGIAPEEFAALTAAPRRYGFHATLKAPFALRPGATLRDLAAALETLAAARAPAPLPPLEPTRLDDFIALVPAGHPAGVNELAAECVRALDAWRAPPAPAELARRRLRRLTERQERHLDRWGYPYVLADYRFHMTLTGSIDAVPMQRVAAVLAAARAAVAALAHVPLVVDALALFEERGPGKPFVERVRMPLGAAR